MSPVEGAGRERLTELCPFRVEVSDAAIDDLRERLARTRWPENVDLCVTPGLVLDLADR